MSKLEMAKKICWQKIAIWEVFFHISRWIFFCHFKFCQYRWNHFGLFWWHKNLPNLTFWPNARMYKIQLELRRSKLPWNCNFLRKMLTEAMPVKVIQICVYLHLLFCQRPIAECLTRCLSVIDFWNVNLGVYYKLEKKIDFKSNLIFFRVRTWFLLPV